MITNEINIFIDFVNYIYFFIGKKKPYKLGFRHYSIVVRYIYLNSYYICVYT